MSIPKRVLRYFALVTACVIGLLAVSLSFRNSILCSTAQYYFRHSEFFPNDVIVECDRSTLSLRRVTFGSLHVFSPSDPEFSIDAKVCQILFQNPYTRRFFSPHIVLKGVEAMVPKKEGAQKRSLSAKSLRSLYSLASFITIHEGTVWLNNNRSVKLSLEREGEARNVSVYENPSDEAPLTKISQKIVGKHLVTNAECIGFDLSMFGTIGAVSLEQGEVKGKVSCTIDKQEIVSLSYGLAVKDIAIRYGSYRFTASELSTTRSNNTQGFSPIDAHWQWYNASLSKDSETIVKNVRATLPTRPGDFLTIKGDLNHLKGYAPFEVKGIRNVSSGGRDVEATILSGDTRIKWELSKHGDQRSDIAVDFSNVEAKLLALLAKGHVPDLDALEVSSGVLSGGVFAHFHRGDLRSMEVEQMALETFALSYDDREVEGSELQGHFRYVDGTVPSWGIHMHDIAMPSLAITKVHGDFSVHERYVIPSNISAKFGDVEGKLTLRGVFPAVKVSSTFEGGLVPYFARFFPNATLSEVECASITGATVEGTVKIHPSNCVFFGEVAIASPEASNHLSFSTTIDRSSMEGRSFGFHNVKETTFYGRDITSELLSLPLGLAGERWRLQGKTTAEGVLTQKGLDLHCRMSTISLDSGAVSISGSEEGRSTHLSYSFEDGKWAGEVPMTDARLSLPSLGLEFPSVAGVARIEGKTIHVDELQTAYEDLFLNGRVVVSFREDGEHIDVITEKVDGPVTTLTKLVSHFEMFSGAAVPVTGYVSQEEGKGIRLKTILPNVGNSEIKWGAELRISQGTYPFGDGQTIDALFCDVVWDGVNDVIHVNNIQGDISGGPSPYEQYHIKDSSLLMVDDMVSRFDISMENPTHEVIALKGAFTQKEELYTLALQDSHLFSLPLDALELSIDKHRNIKRLVFDHTIPNEKCKQVLGIANLFGVVPDALDVERVAKAYDGTPRISLGYNGKKESLHLEIELPKLVIRGIDFGDASMNVRVKEGEITSFHVKGNDIEATGKGNVSDVSIVLRDLHLSHSQGVAKLSDAVFHRKEKRFTCNIDKADVPVELLSSLVPEEYSGYLTGVMSCEGTIAVESSIPSLSGVLELTAPSLGKGELQLATDKPFSFSVTREKGIIAKSIDLTMNMKEDTKHKAELSCALFSLTPSSWDCSAEEVQMLIPPELVLFLAKTQTIPKLSAHEKKLHISGLDIPWENQVDIVSSIKYTGGVLTCRGKVKDGYYWIKDASIYVHDVAFVVQKEGARASAKVDISSVPLGCSIEASFGPSFTAHIGVSDLREVEYPKRAVSINLAKDMYGKVNVKSIEGGIFGLDIGFWQQSHRIKDSQGFLSGKVKADMAVLATLFPQKVQTIFDTVGMGRGYEVGGDCIIDWDDITKSRFEGFLKGKNFELLHSRIQTLMGTIRLGFEECSIDRFTVSDEAGQLSIQQVKLVKDDAGDWNLSIPQIHLQDFRPSLLRPLDTIPGKLKPFVINQLTFEDISGNVSDLDSFTGTGQLTFVNTFKKEYNLLDIPFELIARLGIDKGLLVPVKGQLAYEISRGKIRFTDLKDSCSEGKRSIFYLAKHVPSYISLRGDMNINIRMKQYVILKVTEPFLLSITGSLTKPKYGLK